MKRARDESFRDHNDGKRLLEAVKNKDYSSVQTLLHSGGVNVNYKDGHGTSPLYLACKQGHLKTIKSLIEHDANANIQGVSGKTPLHWTCEVPYDGQLEIFKLLVEYSNVNLNAKCKDGWAPLHEACRIGSSKMVELLVENGADGNVKDYYNKTALNRACSSGNIEIVKILLKKKLRNTVVDVNAKDDSGNAPLFRACEDESVEIATLLIKYGSNVNDSNNEGETPLSWSVWKRNLEMIRLLIYKGANVNAKNKLFQRTPLHRACRNCFGFAPWMDVAKLLIQGGADLNAKDADGKTPLLFARFLELAQLLIDKGANIHIRDNNGMTALHHATGHIVSTAKLLIERGADVHAKESLFGATPLHQACGCNDWGLVKLLVEKSADVNAEDKHGSTPLQWLCAHGCLEKEYDGKLGLRTSEDSIHLEIVDLLTEHGAVVNTQERKCGRTPLHRACKYYNLSMAKKLTAAGADVTARDKKGKTPLHEACRTGILEMVQHLLGQGADVNAASLQGSTPLQVASQRNHLEIVWFLVRQYPSMISE